MGSSAVRGRRIVAPTSIQPAHADGTEQSLDSRLVAILLILAAVPRLVLAVTDQGISGQTKSSSQSSRRIGLSSVTDSFRGSSRKAPDRGCFLAFWRASGRSRLL